MTIRYGPYISDMTYSTKCLFSQKVKYCIRYSFFLFESTSNVSLCIGPFNINAYFPSVVSALNSSNVITFGRFIQHFLFYFIRYIFIFSLNCNLFRKFIFTTMTYKSSFYKHDISYKLKCFYIF